jgi:type III pantothenate kinase
MPDRCIVAIDVGNSRIKAAVLDTTSRTHRLPECLAAHALPVKHSDPANAFRDWLETSGFEPDYAFVGGVSPPVIASLLARWSIERCELTHILRPAESLLVNRTTQPERVGPDRLFDAVAANRVRPAGASAIIIDSGTATTVNRVDATGCFLGGAILAGFELVASALHERTALLPKIDVAELSPPPLPLGGNTESALRSGLYWGLVGGVKELVTRLSATAAEDDSRSPMVLLTGGAAPLLAPHLPDALASPYLTLQGIALSAM